jgi:hypothetical protein
MKVNVVTDNRSWILKRMADESINHPEIEGTVGSKVDPTADINYFVNYNLYEPVGTKTVASFTHHDDNFIDTWNRAERRIDAAVYMAERYKPNHRLTAFIPPAGLEFQHDIFTIGICGTEYTNGRKGGDRILKMAEALKDLPIKWHFYGGNWQILKKLRVMDTQNKFVLTDWAGDKDSINFYKTINLYLCAAYLEGGPVPALEAAKVGASMLCFDVGNTELWGEFATIVELTSEAIEHIRKLVLIHERRRNLCNYNWAEFSRRHYELFQQVLTAENGH